MASASGAVGRAGHGGKARGLPAKVFALAPEGLRWPRGVLFLDLALVPLIVFWAVGHQVYLPSALFGLLFTLLADPGGGLGQRVSRSATFALLGAGVTAAAFALGGAAWYWLTLVVFAVTLTAGLAAVFGARRFAAALLLDVWFVIALALAFGLHHSGRVTSLTWAQVLAWTGGAALWIVMGLVEWLIHGRGERPQPIAEIPGDTSRKKLTPPLAVFALIRALTIAGTVALAFGLELSHGYWMPIAAVVAMKPSLRQAALVSAQRLTGALIGAVAAALLLLVPTALSGFRLVVTERGLEVVALVLFMHGVVIRFWNYALYSAAIAAGALILVGLPQPSDYAAEGYRVLWTLCGAGLALLVMLLAGLLTRRATGAPHPPS